MRKQRREMNQVVVMVGKVYLNWRQIDENILILVKKNLEVIHWWPECYHNLWPSWSGDERSWSVLFPLTIAHKDCMLIPKISEFIGSKSLNFEGLSCIIKTQMIDCLGDKWGEERRFDAEKQIESDLSSDIEESWKNLEISIIIRLLWRIKSIKEREETDHSFQPLHLIADDWYRVSLLYHSQPHPLFIRWVNITHQLTLMIVLSALIGTQSWGLGWKERIVWESFNCWLMDRLLQTICRKSWNFTNSQPIHWQIIWLESRSSYFFFLE